MNKWMKMCMCPQSLSHVWLFVTSWTAAQEAPLSMEFSRQEHWSGLPFTTPGDLPNPGIQPTTSASPVLAGGFFTTEPQTTREAPKMWGIYTMEYCSVLKWTETLPFATTWVLCSKWNKPDRDRQILYGTTYMWNLKKKLHSWTEQNSGCQGLSG